jgi:hypothetical protein
MAADGLGMQAADDREMQAADDADEMQDGMGLLM